MHYTQICVHLEFICIYMHLNIILSHALSSEFQCICRRHSIAHHSSILIESRPAAFTYSASRPSARSVPTRWRFCAPSPADPAARCLPPSWRRPRGPPPSSPPSPASVPLPLHPRRSLAFRLREAGVTESAARELARQPAPVPQDPDRAFDAPESA